MIVDVIRGALLKLAGSTYRTFASTGRALEVVSGKMFQHYGFRSMPKGADLIILRYGNNAVSVAENDASLAPTLSEGQVAVYADGRTASEVSVVLSPGTGSSDGLITISCKTGAITINAGDNVQVVCEQDRVTIKAPSVQLGDDSGLKKLLTESFADLLANHTHALDLPHGLTLAPAQYSAGMISPVNATVYPAAFTSVTEAK